MRSLNTRLSNLAMRYLPDAYLFCLILTFLVFILSFSTGNLTFAETFLSWGNGFFGLLSFSMQMALVLVTGFTLARSKAVNHILEKLVRLPKTSLGAHLLVGVISILCCFFNWGFGLVAAGLFAVKMAKTRKDTSYSLLIASAYAGFLVWHGGLSGSIPLSLSTVGPEIKKYIEVDSIALSETIFSELNIYLLFGVSLTILINIFFLSPKNHHEEHVFHIDKDEYTPSEINSFASFCENSRIFTYLIFFIALVYLYFVLSSKGGLSLNIVIFIFLFLGVFLHQTPGRFLYYFQSSIKECSGIILQFPFYAGIMALMKDSGLALKMSEFFINVASAKTLPLYTYLSAGVVNFFVPSGGGQWAIQGPIMMKASFDLGVNPSKVALALSWGDAWTNMIQPFWALPLLSLAKLELKNIMVHLVIIFLSVGLVSSFIFYFF